MAFAPERSPGPWTFECWHHSLANVILDADGRYLAGHVGIGDGMLMAAAPTLLRALAQIAEVAPEGSEARAIAENAIEDFGEREAITLADWRPGRSEPRLRVVGVAR
jgi:hypothetical protein